MAENNNLRELRSQKKILKKEITEIEDILTFKNKKESLSVLTNGFTDKFLKETETKNGETKLAIDTKGIMSSIFEEIKESASRKNLIGLANDSVNTGLLENSIKMGIATIVGSYAKKNIKNKSFKKKLIGLALVYVAPYALKAVREKLDTYQKERTTSSLEKLI